MMTKTNTWGRIGAAAIVLAATSVLAGCSSAEALPPVIVQIDEIDGTTVEVDEGGAVDLVADDVMAWSAEIDDPEVVGFVPGDDDGSATFNPGLEAKSAGDSGVTLENSETGDSVSFEVVVTAK